MGAVASCVLISDAGPVSTFSAVSVGGVIGGGRSKEATEASTSSGLLEPPLPPIEPLKLFIPVKTPVLEPPPPPPIKSVFPV